MKELLDEDLFVKNLSLLKSVDKYWNLAKRLEQVSLPDYAKVRLSETGEPIIIFCEGERELPLASLYDPVKEAKRWVDSLDLNNRLDAYVVGIGVGYHIDELLSRQLDLIVAVGLNIRLFKLLLHIRDIESWIVSNRVNLLVDLNLVDYLNALGEKRFIDRVLSRPLITNFPPVTTIFRAKTRQYLAYARDNFLNARICLVTNIAIANIQIRNSLVNFPYFLKSAGMEVWFDALKGVPVFCVCPGPSLKDSLPFLYKMKDKAIIVAVDTSVPVLQKNDIDPDIVIGLDFSQQNKRHYEAMDMDRIKDKMTLLVAFCDIAEGILPMWKGKLSVLHMSHMFEKHLFNKVTLFKGVTTAHSAFLFSMFAGADPIMLVGLDLSYPDLSSTHVGGTAQNMSIRLIRDRGVDILAKSKGKETKYVWARWVDGVNGEKVVTEDIFVTYKQGFECMIDACPYKVWDLKKRGAKILGTDCVSDRDVEKYLVDWSKANSIEQIRDRIRKRADFISLKLCRDNFRKDFLEKLESIKELTHLCKDAFEELEDILRNVDLMSEREVGEKVNPIIDELFDERYMFAMQMMQNFSAAVMVMIRKFFGLKKDEVSVRERLDTILAFLEALISAGEDVENLFSSIYDLYREEGLL